MSGEADLGLFGALRILSADVAVDPVFGLTGYGCNVVQSNACLGVTPTDGVFKRLNLITQKLSMALDRDRYTAATVSTKNDALGFTLQNQRPGSPHTTHVTITGMAPGTYPLLVGGTAAGTVTATAGTPLVVALMVGASATTVVQIGSPCLVSGGGSGGAPGMGGAGGPGAGGSPATGGTGGTPVTGMGGNQATGGTPGSGGNRGSGGMPGAGGTGTGGSSATGGTGETGSSGCSCDADPAAPFGAGALVVALLLMMRARQRSGFPGAPRRDAHIS
jgi:MYXO-CTERM domain-containing protein